MGKEMEFFIFLIENYAEYKSTRANKVLKQWDKLRSEERRVGKECRL